MPTRLLAVEHLLVLCFICCERKECIYLMHKIPSQISMQRALIGFDCVLIHAKI